MNKKVYVAGEEIFFSCFPSFPNMSFFRVEYNPNKVESGVVADFVNLVLPNGYCDLVTYGRVSRIDIATDVKNLLMDGFLFAYPSMSISHNYLKSGALETAYLGGKGSGNLFRFYNKVQEMKKSNAKKGKKYKKPLPDYPLTRIELEHRPNGTYALQDIGVSCGPVIKKLWCGIVSGMKGQPETDFESEIFRTVRLSRYEGLPQALYCVPKYRREKVKKAIQDRTYTSWWKPNDLVKTLPNAIEPIINPLPSKWATITN